LVVRAVYSWQLTLEVLAAFVPAALLILIFQRKLAMAYGAVRRRLGEMPGGDRSPLGFTSGVMVASLRRVSVIRVGQPPGQPGRRALARARRRVARVDRADTAPTRSTRPPTPMASNKSRSTPVAASRRAGCEAGSRQSRSVLI
jgi:hypothetical protein